MNKITLLFFAINVTIATYHRPTYAQTTQSAKEAQIKVLQQHIKRHEGKSQQNHHQTILANQGILNLLSDKKDKRYIRATKQIKKITANNTTQTRVFLRPNITTSCKLRTLTNLSKTKHTAKEICQAHFKAHPKYNALTSQPICEDKLQKSLVLNDKTQAHLLLYHQGKQSILVLAIYTNKRWYSAPLDMTKRFKGSKWNETRKFSIKPFKIKQMPSPSIYVSVEHVQTQNIQQPNSKLKSRNTKSEYELLVQITPAPQIIYSIATHYAKYRLNTSNMIHRSRHSWRDKSWFVYSRILESGQVEIQQFLKAGEPHIQEGTYNLSELNHRCLTP